MLDVSEDKKEGQQPVIVKKEIGGHGGHHGGAWKVAYADFVTAMMAFFLVMRLVTQSNIIEERVGGYFRDPAAFGRTAEAGVLETEGGTEPKVGTDLAILRRKLEEAVRSALSRTGEEIRRAVENDKSLQLLRDQIEIEMTDEGLGITLLESSQRHFLNGAVINLNPRLRNSFKS